MHLPHALYSPSPPSGKWYWIKCRQCDVPNAHYFHYSKKFSNDLVNSWILTYCEATRRWRKSVVVAIHLEKSAVMLARWWNGDCDGTGEGGDSNWLDVCIIYKYNLSIHLFNYILFVYPSVYTGKLIIGKLSELNYRTR